MKPNEFFIGQAMEDISAGDAVILDPETGKLRKANQDDVVTNAEIKNKRFPHVWKDSDIK